MLNRMYSSLLSQTERCIAVLIVPDFSCTQHSYFTLVLFLILLHTLLKNAYEEIYINLNNVWKGPPPCYACNTITLYVKEFKLHPEQISRRKQYAKTSAIYVSLCICMLAIDYCTHYS